MMKGIWAVNWPACIDIITEAADGLASGLRYCPRARAFEDARQHIFAQQRPGAEGVQVMGDHIRQDHHRPGYRQSDHQGCQRLRAEIQGRIPAEGVEKFAHHQPGDLRSGGENKQPQHQDGQVNPRRITDHGAKITPGLCRRFFAGFNGGIGRRRSCQHLLHPGFE